MNKIVVASKDRDFYKQVVQILSESNIEKKWLSSIIWVLQDNMQADANVIITDGSVLSVFDEGVPVLVIADAMPKNQEETATVRLYPKGKFKVMRFVLDLEEWLSITEALEDFSRESAESKKAKRKLEEKIKEYESDIQMASNLQKKVMIPKTPEGFSLSLHYQPVNQVSGDFLFIKDIGKKVYIVIGDVTDHGYLSGLYATSLYSLIAGYLETSSVWGLNLTNLVSFVQHAGQFYQTHDEREYVLNQRTTATALFCEIDKVNQIARFINCGHGNEPPIIAYDGGLAEVISFNPGDILPPIGDGLTKVIPLPTEIPFAEGNMLVFYTDGITEIFRNSEEKLPTDEYSKERLAHSVLYEIKKPTWTPASVVRSIRKDAESYSLSEELETQNFSNELIDGASDDVTILAIRWEDTDGK